MEGGNKYILTWETLDGASMHSNCNAPLDLSRFPPRFPLPRCTRAPSVYIRSMSMTLARFYSDDKSVGLCAGRITPLSTSRQIL